MSISTYFDHTHLHYRLFCVFICPPIRSFFQNKSSRKRGYGSSVDDLPFEFSWQRIPSTTLFKPSELVPLANLVISSTIVVLGISEAA